MKFSEIRKKYPEFIYEKYSWEIKDNNLVASFVFKSKEIVFNPVIKIKNLKQKNRNKKTIDGLVFNLGLIEMFSYWKCFCSPKIIIEAGYISGNQKKWWEDVLINGMGQYFYENKIDFTTKNFIEIECSANKEKELKTGKVSGKDILIPVGGGKDSIVTMEFFKKHKKNVSLFALNLNKNTQKVYLKSGYKEMIVAERKIDEKLIELNRKGFLNGHTPFVAYLSFLTVLVSYLFNKKYIAFSNESSANEGNLFWKNKEINHQYSKTYDFENKFRRYSRKYLIDNIEYFSLLRIISEIQIAEIFSSYKKYFPVFVSCNEAEKTYSGTKKKTHKWCENCSKCLFVYIVLSPFLTRKELSLIFKKDLLDQKELLPVFKELVGEKEVKPFECVGTRKEVVIAMYLSSLTRDSYLHEYFKKQVLSKHPNIEKESIRMMENYNNKNFVPSFFME